MVSLFQQSRKNGSLTRELLGAFLILLVTILLLIPAVIAWKTTGSYNRTLPIEKSALGEGVIAFETKSTDDVKLSGWFWPNERAKLAVILCHGIGANRLQMMEQARFLHDAGYAPLLFDFRNHGESGEAKTTLGFSEAQDIRHMIAWLKKRKPKLEIALWGISMGAASVLLAAEQEPELFAIIAESPFDTLENTIYLHNDLYAFGSMSRPVVPMVLFFFELFSGVSKEFVRPIEAVKSLHNTPALFIAGKSDPRMPVALVKQIAKAHPGQNRFLALDGGHAMIYHKSQKTYQKAILTFFAAVDLKNEATIILQQ